MGNFNISHFESFLNAYHESGGTLVEGKLTQDTKNIVKMLANFAPNALPAGVLKPEVIQTKKSADGKEVKGGEEAGNKALESKGQTAYEYAGGPADAPMQMVAYRSAGFNPISGAVRFTKPEYDAMLAEYEASKDVLATEKTDGGDNADTDEVGPPPLDMDAPAADQEAAKPWLEKQTVVAIETQTKALKAMGMEGPDIQKWVKANQRQMRGLGARTLLFKAASEAFGYRDATPAELEQAAKDLTEAQNRAMGLSYQLKNKMLTCDTLPEADRDFLMNCMRLRGTGESQGVYMKGGGDCGGELGSIGGDQLTSGGDVYGLKLGTQNSPIYQQMNGLDEMTCKVGVNDKGEPIEKALVPRGRLASAAANQFNAINGEMNEYYADLAHILFVQKDPKKFKKAYQEMVSNMGKKHNLKLFLEVAKGKAAGDIDQLEVASLAEEGSVQLVDDIAAEYGETPDEKKALAWLVARNLSNWKNVVNNLPAGFEYTKVGDAGAGIMRTEEGQAVSVNADIQADCPKGDAGGTYSRLTVNKKYDMQGTRQNENPACFRASVKDDAHGKWIDAGKRSLGKLRALENEEVNEVRDKQSELIEHIAKADGIELAPDWRQKAEDYRREEVEYVDDMLATVSQLPLGALKDEASMAKSKVPFEKLQRYEVFYDRMEAYNKEKDPQKKARLKAELTTALTQGYRSKNKNNEGMRHNMAIEAAITGMSTEREAFILTGSRGTYMGMESDVAGAAIAQIIGGAEMKFTTTKTKFMVDGREICNVSLRRKDATASQFFVINKEFARENLRLMGEEEIKKESALSAEDFVGQLQKLIQRIDEVSVVKH